MSTNTSPQNQETAARRNADSFKSRIKDFYERYEKYAGITYFGVGFVWDSFTMTRVDSVIDNVILLFYLVIIGVMIVLTLRRQCGIAQARWIQKIEHRFLWAMQFCFGGLFSSYVIFYFKSASFSRTLFFFLILVLLWIGNEFLEQRLKEPRSSCRALLFLPFFLSRLFSAGRYSQSKRLDVPASQDLSASVSAWPSFHLGCGGNTANGGAG